MRLFLAATFSTVCLATATEERLEIPLENIWAYRMPDTRDINDLDDGKARKKYVEPLLKHIVKTWNNDHGLAVQGEGLEALQQFYRIEVDDQKTRSLSTGSPISLVFYTRFIDPHVHIRRVERQGDRITIQYRFEPHRTAMSSQHLALIPLGNLPAGKYVVKIERLPFEKEYVARGFREPSPRQINNVCDSFSFVVQDQLGNASKSTRTSTTRG